MGLNVISFSLVYQFHSQFAKCLLVSSRRDVQYYHFSTSLGRKKWHHIIDEQTSMYRGRVQMHHHISLHCNVQI